MAKQSKKRIWFHRSRSIAWLIIAVLAWPFGWVYSVAFVSIASLYANVTSDWANSEAADNTELLDRIDQLESEQNRRLDRVEALLREIAGAELTRGGQDD